MRNINNIKIYRDVLICGAVVASLGFSSCRQDDLMNYYDNRDVLPSLSFKAIVKDDYKRDTRALSQTPEIIQANDFPGKFYIETFAPNYNEEHPNYDEEKKNPQFGTYIVPTNGSGGMLSYDGPVGDPNKPNWVDIDEAHYFWAWNVPWMEPATFTPGSGDGSGDSGDDSGQGEGGDDNSGDEVGSRAGDDPSAEPGDPGDQPGVNTPYSPSSAPLTLTLQNTVVDEYNFNDSTWNEGSWSNGRVLETFIGAKSGPYDFRHNGPEVPLQFRHLMSKISLRSLKFVAASGNTLENLKANITFVNMPTTFTFYPHPSQDDFERLKDTNPYIRPDGAPIVVTDFTSADPKGGLTFAYTDPEKDIDLTPDQSIPWRDKFYICPEIDFSKLEFYVIILDDRYNKRGEYWGDFSTVAFERNQGMDYDSPTDSDGNPIDDTTVLHAGETMYFDLLVKESGGGGNRIYVQPWSERDNGPTKHYPHRGIYGKGDADDLASANADQSWQTKFELYGDGFTDGSDSPDIPEMPDHIGIFRMYGDVSRSNGVMSFPVGAGYVLNGMGYTMEFNPTSETWDITIGNMVDIYIKVGEYTIYIDPNGVIYQYDASANKYMPTGSVINIHDSTSSYKIDIRTGKFK